MRSPSAVVARIVARAAGVREAEVGRGLLLFTYLFLAVGSFVVGKAARDALFLHRFGPLQLPYVDIAVALLVGVWLSLYIRIGRYVSLRALISGSLVFFASNAVLFYWLAARHGEAAWVFPVIYVWVGMFGVIAPAQVWTLANYVLTTREAKRLYGLIGSGAITGGIVGGFLVQQTALRFGTESTLVVMALALLASVLVVQPLWKRRVDAGDENGEDEPATHATGRAGPAGLRASLRVIARGPYLRSIAAVILLSSFVTAVAAWQFKAIARAEIADRDALAAFFGSFNLYVGIAALLLQWFLTARLLRRFGLGFALFVVPVALTTGSIGFLLAGSLMAVVALRGGDQVLRYSIDRPTVELLYLPVPASQTFQVKSFIDTVVWRLGDGLAGLTVLLFAAALQWTVVQVTWVNLALLAGWLVAAAWARRLYVENLSESINQHRLDAERARSAGLDRAATEILASQLSATDPKQILYALDLFAAARRAVHPAVRGLLRHADPEIRRRAIETLDEHGDTAVLPEIERLLYDEDLPVRTAAMLFIAHHAHIDPLERIEQLGNFEEFSIRSGMVSFLAQGGPTQNLDAARVLLRGMVRDADLQTRREAARLIERLPDVFETELQELLRDADAEIQRHALAAVGRFRKRAFVDLAIARLAQPATADAAASALAAFGERVVARMRDVLVDPAAPIQVRREIPRVLQAIRTPAAEAVLTESLLDGDTALRFRVLTALNKLRAEAPTRPLDRGIVQTVLEAEIMGHLRSYQVLGTLDYRIDSGEPVARALRDSMAQEVERIFRLLNLLYPDGRFHIAHFGVQSPSRRIRDDALEYLENVLPPHLRELLLPLLDEHVPLERRVALATRTLGTALESREQAVMLLAVSSDPWLQACAAYAIGVLGLHQLAPELERWVDADDALLRETARQAREKLDSPV